MQKLLNDDKNYEGPNAQRNALTKIKLFFQTTYEHREHRNKNFF